MKNSTKLPVPDLEHRSGPEVIKTFLMLLSTENEISTAHKTEMLKI